MTPSEITEPRARWSRSQSSNCMNSTKNVLQRSFRSITENFAFTGGELGRGVSGIVRECKELTTGQKFACKSINKATLRNERDICALRFEVTAMEILRDCRGVVSLLSSYEDTRSVHLVMEICEGGDLATRLEKEKKFSEEESAHIFFSLVTAVMYCHENGIVHRDLKPENILLHPTNSFPEVRVADFGVSKFLSCGKRLNEVVGSPYYMSPEMLKGYYSFEVDVWSMGVILYAMLSGRLPFFHTEDEGIFRAILRGKYRLDTPSWKFISSSAKNLISRMLDPEPSRRITIMEILNHSWISDHVEYSASRLSSLMGGRIGEERDDEDDVALVAIPVAIPLSSNLHSSHENESS